jgi:GT2 family glycosyltransferase
MKKTLSIIIPNFNGAKIITKSIPQIVKNSPQANEIIVIDDASDDDSVAVIRNLEKKYKKIKLIVNPKNLGFSRTCNLGVSHSFGDYIVLLNTDIFPKADYLKNALPFFDLDPLLFGVGFAEIGKENWPILFWKDGYLQYLPSTDVSAPHSPGWISGGGSIIRRAYFDKLGGFDPIYEPFYSEDLDLGYRAWKSGYHLLWNPSSAVDHRQA